MTNAELLAKIKAEIERRIKVTEPYKNDDDSIVCARQELFWMRNFLDTLEESERPEPYNPFYDEAYLNEKIKKATESWKGVDVDAMLAECRGYDEEKSEKPIISGDNLESAIDSFWNTASGFQPKFVTLEVKKDGFEKIARHFYDLGCRRTAEKYDELEYNRQRAEEHLAASGKTISVKPGDEVTINGHKIVYDKDKDAITMEEIPNDLEEAAGNIYNTPFGTRAEDFKAGAEWQEQHDAELIEIAYNDGITIGMTKQKEQMMKEAVEGEVVLNPYPTICLDDCKDYDFKDGDKVRVIVLQKED